MKIRDRISEMKGRRVLVTMSSGYVIIVNGVPDGSRDYCEIQEGGDDYFVVERLGLFGRLSRELYAISSVFSIQELVERTS